MATLTIALPGERVEQLMAVAEGLWTTPEDLARAAIEELLTRPEDSFLEAMSFVLQKNGELYRRLV